MNGIYLDYSSNNTIYNNLFNNTNNTGFGSTIYANDWNTTKTAGKNIVGGPNLGGNFWAKPDGTGFSQNATACSESDGDGICDSPYKLNSSNIDYLPLSLNFTKVSGPTPVTSCTTINASGEYMLTRSISNYVGGNCINITSSDVVFDGQGYLLGGNDTNDTYGVYVYNSTMTLTNITVKNLTVTDWHKGIYYNNTANGSIANNTISSNELNGVAIDYSTNTTIVNNTVSSTNIKHGIRLHYSSDNTITNNNASSNRKDGIHIDYSSNYNTLASNTVSNNKHGIHLKEYSSGNTITNNTALNNNYGIYLYNSSSNTLINNTASDNIVGIFLNNANYTIVDNNTASNNTGSTDPPSCGILVSGHHNVIRGNELKDNSCGTLVGNEFSTLMVNNTISDNLVQNNSYTGISIYNLSNGTISGNNASLNGEGISLRAGSFNITVLNNNASNNWYGIYLSSSNNILTNNTASDNIVGIFLNNANYTIVDNNTASNNTGSTDPPSCGILASGHHNVIRGNELKDNSCGTLVGDEFSTLMVNNTISDNLVQNNSYIGIIIYNLSNGTISGNNASLNGEGISLNAGSSNITVLNNNASNNNVGISLYNSNSNLIYNNFLANTNNSYDDGVNSWNTTKTPGTNIIGGPNLGGNYYSDYTGNDTNGDGFGDTPYNIAGSTNVDYLPLSLNFIPLNIKINSPKNKTYYKRRVGFDINVSKPINANASVLVHRLDSNTAPLKIPLVNDSPTHWYSVGKLFKNGTYNALFEVWDQAGHYKSKSRNFSVDVIFDIHKVDINTTNITGQFRGKYNFTRIAIELSTGNKSVSGKINMTLYRDTPNDAPLNTTYGLGGHESPIGMFVEFEPGPTLDTNSGNLEWVIFRLNYSSANLSDLDEDNLSLYWYNSSGVNWVKLTNNTNDTLVSSGGPEVFGTGVNTTDRYVWANLSHFSIYGIAADIVESTSTDPDSPSGSSGGGGGGGGSATSFEVWIKDLLAGQTFELDIDDEDIPYIKGLSLTAKQAIYSSKLSITDYDKKPWSNMEEPDANVFRYFKVSYDKDNYVESASFKVSVNKSWLKANDIDPYKFSVYRYTTDWEELDTKILKEDGEDIHFEVTTPGFSYFSLGGANGSGYKSIKEEVSAPVEEEIVELPETEKEIEVPTPAPAETPSPEPAGPEPEKKGGICGPTALVLISMLCLLFRGVRKIKR